MQNFNSYGINSISEASMVQNHRISWAERRTQGSLAPTPGPAQDSPQNQSLCLRVLSKLFLSSWCCAHCPGTPVRVHSHTLGEGAVLPPLAQQGQNCKPESELQLHHVNSCGNVASRSSEV